MRSNQVPPRRLSRRRRNSDALRLALWALFLFSGLYVGLYVCLVGGIEAIVSATQGPVLNGHGLAWGIVRVLFFELPVFLGWLAASVALGA